VPGIGLTLKDCDNSVVRANQITGNARGLLLDGSATNQFAGNIFSANDTALTLFSSAEGNAFGGNRFENNWSDVVLSGRDSKTRWSIDGRGNSWARYRGFDFDGDGISDIAKTGEASLSESAFTYESSGLYEAHATIVLSDGTSVDATAPVNVLSEHVVMTAATARWKQLQAALAASDEAALTRLFAYSSQDKIRKVIARLRDRLPQLGNATLEGAVSIHADYVDCLVTRVEDGTTFGYHLTLMRDVTGVLKVADF